MTAPIRRRTRAREIAMQVLFQFDLRGAGYADEVGSSVRELCRQEWLAGMQDEEPQAGDDAEAPRGHKNRRGGEQEVVAFAQRLVEGTLQHRDEIDQRLQAVTRNWDLKRMAIVDRNVLRMAAYELLYCADVPPKVAINEAIEIGKKFSTANSGGFINGILDRVRIDAQRSAATADEATPPPASVEQGG